LLSVLIGLAFSDLVGLARERMTLWPLDTRTLRTWGQISAMAACSFSVLVLFAHLGVSRLRIPISLATWRWQVHVAVTDRELASFARLIRPLGPLSVIYIGIPFYAAAGWADNHTLLSPVAETLIAMSPAPAALLTVWIFLREWRRAIELANSGGAG
jgi:hypothetical protein